MEKIEPKPRNCNKNCPGNIGPYVPDMVAECKMAVIRAALGIQALGERELLDRLENLYLEGVKAGYKEGLCSGLS